MSLHINREIFKTNKKRKKPEVKNTKKAIPVFTFPCEATVYTKNDVITVNRNVLAGTKEMAYYEMDNYLKSQNARDYTISITMPQGHHIHLIAQDAGVSITYSFLPSIKSEEARAAKQKRLDLASASRSSKISLARDGLDNADLNRKLQQAHNKSLHIG